jgi:hypothetical protein
MCAPARGVLAAPVGRRVFGSVNGASRPDRIAAARVAAAFDLIFDPNPNPDAVTDT